jgi:hypothetical protein
MIGWWWVWQNHNGTVILLKFQSVAFAKITGVHSDSANRTAKPNMHYSNQAKFVVL